jgi:hypothetical protein
VSSRVQTDSQVRGSLRAGHRHGFLVALVVVGGAFGLAACGSSGASSTNTAAAGSTTPVPGQYAQGVKYADCMRSHGVPTFPDPSPGGGFPLRTSGIDLRSPAYTSAYRACAALQPGGSARPVITASQQAAMIANARCIRSHGVPHFPDPTFAPGGKGVGVDLAPGENPASPAIKRAARACAHVGMLIPGIGVG